MEKVFQFDSGLKNENGDYRRIEVILSIDFAGVAPICTHFGFYDTHTEQVLELDDLPESDKQYVALRTEEILRDLVDIP